MITLLTDFGTSDYFVSAVKGIIHSLNSNATVVDLTHDLPPQDITAAAFTLAACYRDFPRGTIHLAVVDPGVGSARRIILVEAGGYYFVGPDNGIFSLIYQHEQDCRVYHVTQTAFFRPNVSSTFHGRDVFAPIASWLELGIVPESLGTSISDVVKLPFPLPQPTDNGFLAEIIHIDHFGNCITNLTQSEFSSNDVVSQSYLEIVGKPVRVFGSHYAQAGGDEELIAYLGSCGYWEIALWQDSLADKFHVKKGTTVKLRL